MLILIAGITGNLGKHLANEALARGHAVRGLGRSADKVAPEVKARLHSFVESKNYYDIPALEEAVKGVDAIVCAYAGRAELLLDGQLLLLRAAERAGVKRYHSASWNAYWPAIGLDDHESMTPFKAFAAAVRVSSTIKPIYVFTGVLAEVFFSVPGHGDFSPANNGIWDPEKKGLEFFGNGDETWNVTTEKDAAAYSIELITRDSAEQGGFFKVHSGTYSPLDIKRIYGKCRSGTEVGMKRRGSIDKLRQIAADERSKGNPAEPWSYIGYIYQLLTLERNWVWSEEETVCAQFPRVKRTSLEEFLQQNPEL